MEQQNNNYNYRHFPRLTQPRRDLIMRFKEFVESIDRPDLYGMPGEGKWVEELYNYVHQKNSSITIHDVVRWMSTPWGMHMMKKDNRKTADHRPCSGSGSGPGSLAGREPQKVVHTKKVTGPAKIANRGNGKNVGTLSKPKPNPKQKPRPTPTPKSNQGSFYNKAPNNAYRGHSRIRDRNYRSFEANESVAVIPRNLNANSATKTEDTHWSSCSTPSSLSSVTSSSSSSSSESGSSSYSEDFDDEENHSTKNVENCNSAAGSHNRNNNSRINQVMASKPKPNPKPNPKPKPVITIPNLSQHQNQKLVQYYHQQELLQQQQQQQQYLHENPTAEINNSPEPEPDPEMMRMMASNSSASETDIRSLYQNAFEAIEIIHDTCTKIEAIQSCLIPLEDISKIIHRNHHKLIFPRHYTQVVTMASGSGPGRNQVLPIIKIEPAIMQMPPGSSYSNSNYYAGVGAGTGGGLGGCGLQQQQQQLQQEIENPFQNFESSTQSNFRLLSSSQMSSSSTVRHTLSSRNARGTLAASALTTAVSAGSSSAAAAGAGTGAGGVNIEIDDEVNILGSVVRTSSTGLWATAAATGHGQGQGPGLILSNESCNNFHPFIIGN